MKLVGDYLEVFIDYATKLIVFVGEDDRSFGRGRWH